MVIDNENIFGSLKVGGKAVGFSWDSHQQQLIVTTHKEITWDRVKLWLEVLEDSHKREKAETLEQDDAESESATKVRAPRWARCSEAAKHFRVSSSCINHWGRNGRIRRRESSKRHAVTDGPIYDYDISSPRTNVPPKGTWTGGVK